MNPRRPTERSTETRRVVTASARWFVTALLVLGAMLSAAPARAQAALPLENLPLPPKNVGFDQNIGESLPLSATFKDETGKSVTLGDYFGKKPVLLNFAYFTCPMLCGLSMQGLSSSLKGMNLDAGQDFEVLTVSFDPKETPEMARAKKETAMARYARPQAAAGWHFLTGDQAAIESLTSAAGFRYEWDAEAKQYAHATGVVVATPQGQIARYLFGIEYSPRDMRFALVEASQGKLGGVVDQLLLLCYHYDPKAGRYGAIALGSMRTGGALTLVALGAFFIVSVRGERKKKKNPPSASGEA